jgi:hypothetical protein
MPFSVSEAKVATSKLSSAKNQQIIDLLDSDDDDHVTVVGNKSSVAGPIDRRLIDLASPSKRSSYIHQRRRSQMRQQQQQQPEIVDLMDTKPEARKNPNGDLDRKFSPQKRSRTSNWHDSTMSDDDVEVIENFLVAKSKATESPEFLKVSSPKEISPLMSVNHVKQLLTDNNGNPESVVADILSKENYPKQQASAEGGTDGAVTTGTTLLRRSSSLVVERLRTQPRYDYSSPSAFQPTAGYMENSIQLLLYDFPFLKIPAIRSVFHNNHFKYTLARRHINDAIVGKEERLNILPLHQLQLAKNKELATTQKPVNEKEENRHFQVLNAALIRGRMSEESIKRLGPKVCLRRGRKTLGTARPIISDEILQDEVHHFEEEMQEWMDKIQKRLRRDAARKMSVENGSSVLCQCCYEDVAVSECLPCRDNGVSAPLLTPCFYVCVCFIEDK